MIEQQLIFTLGLTVCIVLFAFVYTKRVSMWEPTGRKRWRVKYDTDVHTFSVYEREFLHIKSGKIKWIETNGSDIKLKENSDDSKD